MDLGCCVVGTTQPLSFQKLPERDYPVCCVYARICICFILAHPHPKSK